MIVLFTDFGTSGPYLGEMQAVLHRQAPGEPVINLFADAPAFDARRSAYLLAAWADGFAVDTVFVGVVDPGVGGERAPVILRADGRWYVGPDNGLFALLGRRSRRAEAWVIDWRPVELCESFHGRDLFAPVAARIARGGPVAKTPLETGTLDRPDWPDDLGEICYIDHYGNAITGLRGRQVDPGKLLVVGGYEVAHARVFCEAAEGTAFWYSNSVGLVEIAVNGASACESLGLAIGEPVQVSG